MASREANSNATGSNQPAVEVCTARRQLRVSGKKATAEQQSMLPTAEKFLSSHQMGSNSTATVGCSRLFMMTMTTTSSLSELSKIIKFIPLRYAADTEC